MDVRLFGCNNGLIARALSTRLGPQAVEPYTSHLTAGDLISGGLAEATDIIIDANPERHGGYVGVYRLQEVYGYSDSSWTPML